MEQVEFAFGLQTLAVCLSATERLFWPSIPSGKQAGGKQGF